MKIRLPLLSQFGRNARLLIIVSGAFAVSFFGVHMLLKVLYLLRLGHGPEYVGLFNAAGALTYMGMGLPSGALGTRFGPRKVMLAGGVIIVLGMVLLPLAEYVPLWARTALPIGSQVVLTAGWSMYNVNLVPALMASTATEKRNSAFAVSGAVRESGTLVGTLFGGMLPGLMAGILGQTPDDPGPYRFALWIGSALALAALVPLALIGPLEPVIAKEQEAHRGRFPLLPIALMAGYVYVRHAGWATCQGFCNAYLDAELRLSASSIGLIGGAGQFLAILASALTPRLAARRSNGWMLVMASLGTAISLLPLALVPNWAAAGLGRLGIVALSAIWLPALQVYQMELVDSQWRTLAYGAVSMAMGLGFGTTSLAGGYVIAARGYRSLFLVGVVLSLAATALMWGILRVGARGRRTIGHSPAERQSDRP